MKYTKTAKLSYKTQNITGEGVTWIESTQTLLWVDIEGKTLYIANEDLSKVETHVFEKMITTLIPDQSNPQDLIIAHQDELIRFNLISKAYKKLVDIPTQGGLCRTNDGKASPFGNLWLGVMHLSNHNETGALYRVNKDLSIDKVLDSQCIPNGICWNKEGDIIYYADSGKSRITAYRYNSNSNELGDVLRVIEVPAEYGTPDGMTIDQKGNLWVAHWGGFGVYIWNPENGDLLGKVGVPVPHIASCTFGGKDKNTLYITTARAGLSVEELTKYPLSGSLFSCEVDAQGAMNHYPF